MARRILTGALIGALIVTTASVAVAAWDRR